MKKPRLPQPATDDTGPRYPYRFDVLRSYKGRPVFNVRLALTAKEHRRASEVGGHFGLSVERFLEAFFNHKLPRQFPRWDAGRPKVKAKDFRFESLCPQLALRLKRVAKSDGVTVQTLLARAIGGDLNATQEVWVMHPDTGEFLICQFTVEEWRVSERCLLEEENAKNPGDTVELFRRGRELAKGGEA